MSDFLTNLAARAIAAPSLRPRARSRFEPESEVSEPAMVGERALATSRPALAAPSGSNTPEDQRIEAVRPVEAQVARHETASSPAMHVPSATHREEAAPREVATSIEREVQRVIETKETIVRVPQVERVAIDREPVPPVERIRERERVEVERPHRFERQAPRVLREPEARVHRQAEKRDASSRVPTRPAPTSPQSQSQSMTATSEIHVSIGRIDVRAVPPPQPHARGEQRGPKMSIDDYVARRKARERR